MKKLLLSMIAVLLGLTTYAAPKETTLWEGDPVTLEYSINPSIAASQCTEFEEWGEIVVYYEVINTSDYVALAVIKPSWQNFSWGGANAVPLTANKKSFFLTADDVTSAKSGGMGIMGWNLKVSKVVYRESQGPLDPAVLQRDEVVINSEQASLDFSYDDIVNGGGKVGGGIAVEYSVLNPMNYQVNFKHQGVAAGVEQPDGKTYTDEEAPYVWADFTNPQTIDEDGRMILYLNEETMNEL